MYHSNYISTELITTALNSAATIYGIDNSGQHHPVAKDNIINSQGKAEYGKYIIYYNADENPRDSCLLLGSDLGEQYRQTHAGEI